MTWFLSCLDKLNKLQSIKGNYASVNVKGFKENNNKLIEKLQCRFFFPGDIRILCQLLSERVITCI